MIFTQSLAHLQKVLHAKYDLSSTIQHRGERGRQRENGLLTFLRDTLPGAYGVATGEIIPFLGREASPQCDIIIFDHLYMPILGRTSAVQQIPLEAVYAVIECKSRLDSSALKDAGRKFDKIRALPRCPSKRRLRKDMSRGPEFFVFGYHLETSTETCIRFARRASKKEDVHVTSLDSGCSIWVDDSGRNKCLWMYATSAKLKLYETLALFYVMLLDGIRKVDLGNPSYTHMFFNGE